MEALVKGPDAAVWQGRRVFLTGHTGFKGGWLALWLHHLGAHVRGYALDPATTPNLTGAAQIPSVLDDVRGDITDPATLTAALAAFAPEIVFHLAAQPLVRLSYAEPLRTFQVNVMGTANLLEAVRQTPGVRAVVCVTTDKVYENRERLHAYRENDRLGGYDPYSSSKAAAELVAAAYRQSYFPVSDLAISNLSLSDPRAVALTKTRAGIATARAGNVIGGGDWSADRLIPDLVRSFVRGEPASIRRPDSVRPWQHVLEPLWGYLRLAEELFHGNPVASSAWNFGPRPQDAWPVRRVVDAMMSAWGPGAQYTLDPEPGAHEAGYLMLDASRAGAHLHWHPALTLDDALLWLVRWYRAHAAGEPMQAYTLQQIADYEALLRRSV